MKKGFTLIELLVVIVVLMSTGIVIGSILFSTLRGASKASILTTARQNGEYALSQMVKTIRNAQKFGGVAECDPVDTVNCGKPWIKDCSDSESAHYRYIKITSPDKEEIVYSCNSKNIFSNTAPLIDEVLVEVKDSSCYFTCFQSSSSDSPTIGINFTIIQKKDDISVENTVSLPFSTSVRIRNSLQ